MKNGDRIVGRAYVLGTQMDPADEPPSASLNAAATTWPAEVDGLRLLVADLQGQLNTAMRGWVATIDAWKATLPVVDAVRAWRRSNQQGANPPMHEGFYSAEEVALAAAWDAYNAAQGDES